MPYSSPYARRYYNRISGSNVIGASCSTTYTLLGLPIGATPGYWDVLGGSASGLTPYMDTGTSFTTSRTPVLTDPQYATIRFSYTFNSQTYYTSKSIVARIAPVIAAGVVDLATHQAVSIAQTGKPYYFKSLIPSDQKSFVQAYEWYLGMNGGLDFMGETTQYDPVTFSTPGTYTLSLRIRDGCQWSKWVSTNVYVQ